VAEWLDRAVPEGATLLWVTGRGTYGEFARYHRPPGVQVLDFLDPMADGYSVADLVVSRAGMITVAELCAWGLPSVLVPLPTAAADHQTRNARVLAEAGAALLLPQAELSGPGWPARWLNSWRTAGAGSRSRRLRGAAADLKHRMRSRPNF